METLFENKEQVKRSDIPIQIMRGILFLILLFFISKIRFINNEINPNITLILAVALGLTFIYLILNNKTIKRIEKNTKAEKLTFTFTRQLRSDLIKEMNIADIKLNLKKVPTRGTSKKVLLISDKNFQLKLSTNQIGISETELNLIMNEIKALHTTSVKRK